VITRAGSGSVAGHGSAAGLTLALLEVTGADHAPLDYHKNDRTEEGKYEPATPMAAA